LSVFIPQEDRKAFRTHLNMLTKTRSSQSWEQRLQSMDGPPFPALITVRSLSPDSGSPVTLFWMIQDISERKQAQEQLRRQQTDLAYAHRLSTIGEITAVTAHELNQPLTALLAYAQGAARRFHAEAKAHPELGEMLEQITKLAKRAADVVRGIRDFVRNQNVEWQIVDVNALIRDTVCLVGAEIERKKIKTALHLSSELPPLQGNPVSLQQLLLNLILNGIEAMAAVEAQRRSLTLSTFLNAEHEIEISVADTGAGLSPEVKDRLFDPFVSTKKKGLGLGLSICRTIAESHRGCLWAHSNPECGATFHVIFPLPRDR
jgi:C4-dicarboxylate-specific signal transduction histidine kinase